MVSKVGKGKQAISLSRYSGRRMIFFHPYLRTLVFLLLLERKEGREKNIDTREKHWSLASHTHPDPGLVPGPRTICIQIRGHRHWHQEQRSNPQPRYVPWPGIEPTTVWLWDDAPTNWATLARAGGEWIFSGCDKTRFHAN